MFRIQPSKVGTIPWGQIINAGTNIGLTVYGQQQSGGQQGQSNVCNFPVSGNEAMARCVPQIMAMFAALEARTDLTPEQMIAGAEQIAAIFSDGQYFNQSIGGDSKRIREAAQTTAAARVAAIKTRYATAATIPTPQQTHIVTTNDQGQLVTQTISNSITAGSSVGIIDWIEAHPVTGGAVAALIAFLVFKKS